MMHVNKKKDDAYAEADTQCFSVFVIWIDNPGLLVHVSTTLQLRMFFTQWICRLPSPVSFQLRGVFTQSIFYSTGRTRLIRIQKKKGFGGHVLFWGLWYTCFGFLVMSTLGFKARGAALFALQRRM